MQSYAPHDIKVPQDGCKLFQNEAGDPAKATNFQINSVKVPILNVLSRDSGSTLNKFGSPLTKNPAWLR